MVNRRRVYHPKSKSKQPEDLGGLQRDNKKSNADSVNIKSPRVRRKNCD